MHSRIRMLYGIAVIVVACVLITFLPVRAQTPTIPQTAPTGTIGTSPDEEVVGDPGADIIGPGPASEVASVTSSDPTIVAADVSQGTFTGQTINYQCKKAGVAVVTVTLKNGKKYFTLVGCGAHFPFSTVDYTRGQYNSHSYLCWIDQKGTLICNGLYKDSDGNSRAMNISVPNYQLAAAPPAKPQPPKPTPTPSQAPPNTNGGGD